jgi:hypothetical protein
VYAGPERIGALLQYCDSVCSQWRPDQAYQYLEKAYSDEDLELLIVIRLPAFDPIRSDPRYADPIRRLGLPE